MILLYAFSNRWGTNISRRVYLELMNVLPPCQGGIKGGLVYFSPQQFFHKFIDRQNYSLIVGLGDGSKFSNKIHIETQTKNSYNDQSIYPFSSIFLDINLPNVDIYDPQFFKISSNMGTYHCNCLAYLTQLYINQHSPQTLHLFLHLPPGLNAAILAQKISDLIKDNHLF